MTHHGVLVHWVNQISTHNILQPREMRCRQVREPAPSHVDRGVDGWGEGRKKGEREEEQGETFLKKSHAPSLDRQITEGHPMLRGRYEKEKSSSPECNYRDVNILLCT